MVYKLNKKRGGNYTPFPFYSFEFRQKNLKTLKQEILVIAKNNYAFFRVCKIIF